MKDRLFDKAIKWTEKKGFTKIKANTDEFDTPTVLTNTSKGTSITPDITGVKFGTKSYIEIAVKSEDERTLVSKWKLFGTLAARKGGKLYLLAGKGHKAFASKIVKDYQLINATVISI